MLVADTNILIYYLKGTEKVVRYFLADEELFISTISQIELLSRSDLSATEIKKLKDFLETFTIIDVDSDIALKAAQFRRKGIKIGDAIIAATAWRLGAPLLTHDHGFGKIKEIKVIDPMR